MPDAIRTCSAESCDRPLWARGWCNTHYARWRRNGALTPDRLVLAVDPIPGEQWCPVVGFDGYEVSDTGRVRSCKGSSPQLLRPQIRKGGYQAVALSAESRRYGRLVHRLVLEAFVGTCPEGMEGCHNDGNQVNNRLTNLRWATPVSNAADKKRHGTQYQLNKTHCTRGHLLAQPNLVPSAAGYGRRLCRACAQARSLQRNLRNRATAAPRPFDLQAEANLAYERILAAG